MIKDEEMLEARVINVLLNNLNALEEAVYEIVDKMTLEKIVARKIELQNNNRVAKAVKESEAADA